GFKSIRSLNIIHPRELAHLVDVDPKVRENTDKTVGVGWCEAVISDEPIHQVNRSRLDGDFERAERIDGYERLWLFDSHPWRTFGFYNVELGANRCHRLRRCAGKLGIALAGMHIAKVEKRTGMVDGQQDAVAGAYVADVEVSAPFALAVQASRHFTVGCDAQCSDERRNRPPYPVPTV